MKEVLKLTAGKRNKIRFLAYTLSLLVCTPASLAGTTLAAAQPTANSTSQSTSASTSTSSITSKSNITSTATAAPKQALPTTTTTTTTTTVINVLDKNDPLAANGDVMLRAFKDEMQRTQTKLTLDGHPPPYFSA